LENPLKIIMTAQEEIKLLEWAVQNSQTSAPQDQGDGQIRQGGFDQELVDYILGKSDAQRMIEAVKTASSETQDNETRNAALEDLEALVERHDNACDVDKLRLWPLISRLTEEPVLAVMAWWVVGTAAQNNPQVQEALLPFQVLERTFSILEGTSSKGLLEMELTDSRERDVLVHKAFYVVSAMAKPKGFPGHGRFVDVDGYRRLQVVRERTSDLELRHKLDFLLDFLKLSISQ
jgi:hypothetical protein